MRKLIKNILNTKNIIYSKWLKKQLASTGINFSVRRKFMIRNGKYIYIGDNFLGMNGTRIEAWDGYGKDKYNPEIIIGDNVSMNVECHISAINKIKIGNGVLLGSRVFITDHSHGSSVLEEIDIPPNSRQLFSKGAVIIEDNVWIGEGAVILPDVKVGYGSIVGANAVVTKNVPSGTVVGGCPARVLKKL